jgi:hypothetical protein
MGLLDEAIREHLELKRRTGADPSAIARAEREALAPVFPDERVDPDANGEHLAHDGSGVADAAPTDAASVEDHRHGADRITDLSPMSQETAELDMQAVMEEDSEASDSQSLLAPIGDVSLPAALSGETPPDDSLEWEAPSEGDRESVSEDAHGQERLALE